MKKTILIFTMLLILGLLVACNQDKQEKPIDFGKINATSLTAQFWPSEDYDITKADDINTVMDCVKRIKFTKKIKAFNGQELGLMGCPQTLVIKHQSGTISIILYNEKVIIEDSQASNKRYYEITPEEFRVLYDTVVTYRGYNLTAENADMVFSKLPSPPMCKKTNDMVIIEKVIELINNAEKSPIENKVIKGWSMSINITSTDGIKFYSVCGNILTIDNSCYTISQDFIDNLEKIYNEIDIKEEKLVQ